jgi:hypothetical protein
VPVNDGVARRADAAWGAPAELNRWAQALGTLLKIMNRVISATVLLTNLISVVRSLGLPIF